MTHLQLRAALAAALVASGFVACARTAVQPKVVGPVIGESTAEGPRDPTAPPPPPQGVTETSGRLYGTPTQVANPVATPPASAAAGTADTLPAPATDAVNSGALVAPIGTVAPVTPTGTGVNAAGPNGPGTGNGPATPVGAGTARTTMTPSPHGPGPTAPTPTTTTPITPATPTPATPAPGSTPR